MKWLKKLIQQFNSPYFTVVEYVAGHGIAYHVWKGRFANRKLIASFNTLEEAQEYIKAIE